LITLSWVWKAVTIMPSEIMALGNITCRRRTDRTVLQVELGIVDIGEIRFHIARLLPGS
jgi:hypothetical protein